MKLFFFILFSTITISGCFSFGNREKANSPQNPSNNDAETITAVNSAAANEGGDRKIIGTVQIYGSEPHTFVGIVDQDKTEYAVYPASMEDELRKLQGYLIEFTVIFLDEPQGYGSLFLKGGTVTPVKWEIIQ